MGRDHLSGKPGGYARQRYERGLRRWRAKMRKPLALMLSPFVLGSIYVEYRDPHWLQWSAGMAMGGAMCMWMWVRDSPPPYVENWNRGFEGEAKTAKAIEPLRDRGWQIVHDIQTDRGNYDHVLIGPAGVFLLDSKNLRGQLAITNGKPNLVRTLDDDSVADVSDMERWAVSNAASLHQRIRSATRFSQWVHAVIVVWSDFPEEIVANGACTYVHGSKVREWLEAQPDKLHPTSVERFAQVVHQIQSDPEAIASQRTPRVPARG